VHRFQELDSDEENNGVSIDRGPQQVSNGKILNPDELYFNDMDIRAWERRASAEQDYSYQDEHEDHYDDAGDLMTADDYEEVLFRRVLDKIRIARAAGSADVDLSSEEIEAYQSKLHGARAPAARPRSSHRHDNSALVNDSGSVATTKTSSKHGKSSTRSKKDPQRTSIFGSKPKKEKPDSRKRSSTMSSSSSHAPPGFVIPGPDGQPLFTPVNAYQGTLARERGTPPQPNSYASPDNSRQNSTPPRRTSSRDILGAFPGSEDAYQPVNPVRQGRTISSSQLAYEQNHPPENRTRSSSIQSAPLIPFPVEPYQYHHFSPSSGSPASPPQYVRNVSATPSEASYKSVPRRVPVSVQARLPVQRTASVADTQVYPAAIPPPQAFASGGMTGAEGLPETVKPSGSGKDGERRKKSGRSRKKA
jgi:hypothetical protein